MADIFGGTRQTHGAKEIVLSHGVLVNISGAGGGDHVVLAQSVNINYQRTVQPVYEIGSEDIWVMLTPASGTCQLSRAVSDQNNVFAYVADKDCNDYEITVGAGKGECTAKAQNALCKGCYTQAIGLQVQAGQGFLTESMTSFVGSLEQS